MFHSAHVVEPEWCIYASPGRHQAIIWTNNVILLIGPLEINLSVILIEINSFSLMKMHLKMSSSKRLFLLGLNVLRAHMITRMTQSTTRSCGYCYLSIQSTYILYKQFSLFVIHILKLRENLFPVHMFTNVGFPRFINTHENILGKAGTDMSCNLGRMWQQSPSLYRHALSPTLRIPCSFDSPSTARDDQHIGFHSKKFTRYFLIAI